MSDSTKDTDDTCEGQLGLPGCRTVREHLKLTQQELAAQSGLHVNYINSLECGRRDCRQHVQRRIAQVLNCKVSDLLEVQGPERLKQIEIAHKRQELEHLEAGDQKGVA